MVRSPVGPPPETPARFQWRPEDVALLLSGIQSYGSTQHLFIQIGKGLFYSVRDYHPGYVCRTVVNDSESAFPSTSWHELSEQDERQMEIPLPGHREKACSTQIFARAPVEAN